MGVPFGSNEQTYPVRAVRHWLRESGIRSGPVFRSVNRHGRAPRRGLHKDSVGSILKRAAKRAHMKTEPIAGHSLRAGCVTHAALNGVSERDIMRQTGHQSSIMLGKYIRIGQTPAFLKKMTRKVQVLPVDLLTKRIAKAECRIKRISLDMEHGFTNRRPMMVQRFQQRLADLRGHLNTLRAELAVRDALSL